jgi:hypothetical protein
MEIGFDVISDLNLSPEESFNWEGKSTSLYCIVAGNVSSDLRTVLQTLAHLSKQYQGVFYTPGSLEYEDCDDINARTHDILSVCSKIHNLAVLHHNVVIIDGVAILGANGWGKDLLQEDDMAHSQIDMHRMEDTAYLHKSLEKLQRHLDVKKILVVSSAVPHRNLYFNEEPEFISGILPLVASLVSDTESKVSNWVFGTHEKIVDTTINNINYCNNPYLKRNPYWAKRVTVEF